MKVIITENQLKRVINEISSVFPVGNDNFNVGFDEPGLGRKRKSYPKYVLDKNKAIQNSDYSAKHGGIDIFAPEGTPAVASIDGVVTKIGSRGNGGNTVTISDGTDSYYYAHLMEPSPLRVGDEVKAGEDIGLIGKTGNAINTHPHIHYSQYTTDKGYKGGNKDPWPELMKTLGDVPNLQVSRSRSRKSSNKPSTTSKTVQPTSDEQGIFDSDLEGKLGKRWGGNSREDVERIQTMLYMLGYDLGTTGLKDTGIDGKYGPKTEKAIIKFQETVFDDENEWDGVVGPKTYYKLYKEIEKLGTKGVEGAIENELNILNSDGGVGVGDSIPTYEEYRRTVCNGGELGSKGCPDRKGGDKYLADEEDKKEYGEDAHYWELDQNDPGGLWDIRTKDGEWTKMAREEMEKEEKWRKDRKMIRALDIDFDEYNG